MERTVSQRWIAACTFDPMNIRDGRNMGQMKTPMLEVILQDIM